MAMNPKDFTVEAAKSYLEKEYPFVNIYKNLTETDKINAEKLANAAREKLKNPSSTVWDSMVKGQAIIGEDKFLEELPRAKAMADEIIKAQGGYKLAKAAPMETPYGKSLLSYTPEGKIAGKTGAALRGLGKLAEKALPYVSGAGVALTALDLGQALSEVQDKGAAKIAEDYKNSQLSESEDTGDKMMMKMEPIVEERGLQKAQEYMSALKKEKQYTPEERMKLKEMLNKLRSGASLRGSVSKSDYPTYKTNYDSVRDYLKNAIPQDGKEFDGQESYDNIKRV